MPSTSPSRIHQEFDLYPICLGCHERGHQADQEEPQEGIMVGPDQAASKVRWRGQW